MPDEKAPELGAFPPALLMYFLSGEPMYFCSGVDNKWLTNHRRPKWAAFYSQQGLNLQKRFFDYYLKGEGDGLASESRVTLEVNRNRTDFVLIKRSAWPPEDTNPLKLHLDLADGRLIKEPRASPAKRSYDSKGASGLYFDYEIETRLMIVGNSKVRLWVSAETADDMDLFVGVEKLDADGDRVFFYGFGGTNPNDIIARGWLRVSHRELDAPASTDLQPIHKHQQLQKLKTGEVVPVDIELLPSATIFEPGETLRLVVQGTPIQPDAGLLGYNNPINNGLNTVHSGGKFDSYLLVPGLHE